MAGDGSALETRRVETPCEFDPHTFRQINQGYAYTRLLARLVSDVRSNKEDLPLLELAHMQVLGALFWSQAQSLSTRGDAKARRYWCR